MKYLIRALGLLVFVWGNTFAHACLWDRDTLAQEALGLPGMLEVGSGRIERFPDLYYEMRLQRLLPLLAETDDPTLYDDVAVALDRLGRSGEAIQVMADKKTQFGERFADPDFKDHFYRYLANLGTFHVHRWLAAPEGSKDETDLLEAQQLLNQALIVEPNAHFGREQVQLSAVNYLVKTYTSSEHEDNADDDSYPFWMYEEHDDRAVEGLIGLIALGNAWESAVVYRALADVLSERQENMLAYFVYLRTDELGITKGMEPLDFNRISVTLHVPISKGAEIKKFYEKAREATTAWREHRNGYISERLQAGEHPDTHADFWRAYEPEAFPSLWGVLFQELLRLAMSLFFLTLIFCVPMSLVYFFWKPKLGLAPVLSRIGFFRETYCLLSFCGILYLFLFIPFGVESPLTQIIFLLTPLVLLNPAQRRLKDLGWNPTIGWLMIVPLANLFMWLLLGFIPGKRQQGETLEAYTKKQKILLAAGYLWSGFIGYVIFWALQYF